MSAPDPYRDERERNPFITHWTPDVGWVGYVDVKNRLDMVKQFDIEECRKALRMRSLQKTVRTAVERRLRKLEKRS